MCEVIVVDVGRSRSTNLGRDAYVMIIAWTVMNLGRDAYDRSCLLILDVIAVDALLCFSMNLIH